MARLQLPRPRDRRGLPRASVLDEQAWLDRREILAALGLGGALLAGASAPGCRQPRTPADWVPDWDPAGGRAAYPAARNDAFEIRRALTPENTAAVFNNFYEFLPSGAGPVHRHVGGFRPRPWQVTIGGLVEEERTIDVDEVARIAPLEERLYHFRCVEAWSMVVPWTGIPMRDFVAWCRPKSNAKFVRFVSFSTADLTAEQKQHTPPGFAQASHYSWPYYEGLRMDEAVHPLAFLATGIYGHGLPMQHGAPVRVIVPWKYGYKSPKSIVRVEFTEQQPRTFWNDLTPSEYGFLSNVEPDVPHPRWSQATERDLATGDRIRTLPYNGYADAVASLY